MRGFLCSAWLALAPPAEGETESRAVPQIGLMPLELEGTARSSVRAKLSDALRTGLLRGRVEINVFDHNGVCATPACREALADVKVVVVRPAVRVDGGSYTLKLEMFHPGETSPAAKFEKVCEGCKSTQAAKLLTELAADLLAQIEKTPAQPEPAPDASEEPEDEPEISIDPDPPAPPPTETTAPPASPRPEPPPSPAPRDRRAPRAIGWTALASGIGLAGAGTAMLVLDGTPHRPTCPPEQLDANGACPNLWTTRNIGIGLMAGAGALVATGIGLLIHGYRAERGRARSAAQLFGGPGTLGLVGRF